jgi:hypothetical protein
MKSSASPAAMSSSSRTRASSAPQILEPIRAKFGPVRVHDGYRDPGHNRRVGGKADSFHLFEWGSAAADIDAQYVAVRICSTGCGSREAAVRQGHHGVELAGVPATVHIQVDRLNAAAAPGLYGPHGRRGDVLAADGGLIKL